MARTTGFDHKSAVKSVYTVYTASTFSYDTELYVFRAIHRGERSGDPVGGLHSQLIERVSELYLAVVDPFVDVAAASVLLVKWVARQEHLFGRVRRGGVRVGLRGGAWK